MASKKLALQRLAEFESKKTHDWLKDRAGLGLTTLPPIGSHRIAL